MVDWVSLLYNQFSSEQQIAIVNKADCLLTNSDNPFLSSYEELLSFLVVGDIIEFRQEVMSHWAIYAGFLDKRYPDIPYLIHFYKYEDDPYRIRADPLTLVANDCECRINNGPTDKTSEQILMAAITRIGEENYHPLTNNSQHFVNMCRYGIHGSSQTRNLLSSPSLWWNAGKCHFYSGITMSSSTIKSINSSRISDSIEENKQSPSLQFFPVCWQKNRI